MKRFRLAAAAAAIVMICGDVPRVPVTAAHTLTLPEFAEALRELPAEPVLSDDGAALPDAVRDEFQTARLIVKAACQLGETGAQQEISGCNDLHILQYDTVSAAYDACQRFQADSRVQWVQPSHIVQLDADAATQSAELCSELAGTMTWGADVIGTPAFIAEYLQAEVLPEVTVAVIDTGINTEPELFAGRILDGGMNFSNSGDDSVSDDLYHGTHVTGTICELTPSNVKILPEKVFDKYGKATDEQIYAGIVHAIEMGAGILNMSFGGLGVSPLEVEALAIAEEQGVICVAAAGNSANRAEQYYPGGIASAITVGAVNSQLQRAGFSNYGESVDVMAPGVGILSYMSTGTNTEKKDGTSMATPHVAACCALLRSYDPEMTPARAEALLRLNAKDLGEPGFDSDTAWGLVNMAHFRWDDGICRAPDFSVAPGNFGKPQTVELTCKTDGAAIYYTADGTLPTKETGTLYTEPITVTVTTRLRAVAVRDGWMTSVPAEAVYMIGGLDVPEPFTVSGGVLTAYRGVRNSLTVPDEIGGQIITAVADGAFAGNHFLESLTLPDAVTSLGSGVCTGCTQLKTVTANGVQTVGAKAFSDCAALESVAFSDALTSLGEAAFSGCAMLKSVNFPKLTAVPDECFFGCASMKTAFLPHVTAIGAKAFSGCGAMTALTCRWDSVTEIGTGAMTDCAAWRTKLALPAIQTLGDGACSGCASLAAVYLPEEFASLPNSAFSGCSGMKIFSAPGVTALGDYALALKKNDADLELILPFDRIETVGEGAFSGCPLGYARETVTFSALKTLKARAFSGVIAGVMVLPAVTVLTEGAFDGARTGILYIEQAEELQARSAAGAAGLVVSSTLKTVSETAWDAGSDIFIITHDDIPALKNREDYTRCAEPLVIGDLKRSVSGVQHHAVPMQVTAGAPGLHYQWYRADDDDETALPDTDTPVLYADSSEPGDYVYACLMKDSAGAAEIVRFTVHIAAAGEIPAHSTGSKAVYSGTERLFFSLEPAQGALSAEGPGALTGTVTDAAGQPLARFSQNADGSAVCEMSAADGARYLEIVPRFADSFAVSDAGSTDGKSYLDIELITVPETAYYAYGTEYVPPVSVRNDKGQLLRAGRDYITDVRVHNQIVQISVFGLGAYGGYAAVSFPAYQQVQAESVTPVSLRSAADRAVFRFVPSVTGTYQFYAARAAGYAAEQEAYARTGRYAGGSKYVSISTNCTVSDKPDGTGDVIAYSGYTPQTGSYFWGSAELYAGQPYYFICAAESAAEYALVLTAGERADLSQAKIRGSFTQYYTGSALRPDITVTLGGETLTEGVDYLRADLNNVLPGTASVYVYGTGRYTGSVLKTYPILHMQDCTDAEITPLDTPVEVVCGKNTLNTVWFRAAHSDNNSVYQRYRILNEKISGGKALFTLFRYHEQLHSFTPVTPSQDGDYSLKNGLYCILVRRQYSDVAASARITAMIPFDLNSITVEIQPGVYTGSPVEPEMTVFADDGRELVSGVDFEVLYPDSGENIMFGDANITLRPTARSYGLWKGIFPIRVVLPENPPVLETGSHSVRVTMDERLAVYQVSPETDTEYTLATPDVMNIVLRVFSPEAEMLEQVYGSGTQSLSFAVPGGETRYIMVKFNGTDREGTIRFALETDFRLLKNCEQTVRESVWNGERIVPEVEFRDGDYVLKEGVDYQLRYTADDVKIGTATANFTGLGAYFGTCDVSYSIIAEDLFKLKKTDSEISAGQTEQQESAVFFPVTSDRVYGGDEQGDDDDYLVYCYTSGVDTTMRLDLYDCYCYVTVQVYGGDGEFLTSGQFHASGSMTFDIGAGETRYLLLSKTKVSDSNDHFRLILRDADPKEWTVINDAENGVTYRILPAQNYAEVYALDTKQNPVRLAAEVSQIPVQFVPEGLFAALPAGQAVVGYPGCPAAQYADLYHFAYLEEPAVTPLTAGDLNGDGRCSVADAVLLSHIITEDTVLPVPPQRLAAADLNGDGVIDLLDFRALMKQIENGAV